MVILYRISCVFRVFITSHHILLSNHTHSTKPSTKSSAKDLQLKKDGREGRGVGNDDELTHLPTIPKFLIEIKPDIAGATISDPRAGSATLRDRRLPVLGRRQQPRLLEWVVGEMHQLGFADCGLGIPGVWGVAQVARVVLGAEFARQERVLAVRQHEAGAAEEMVRDLHVVGAVDGVFDGFLDALEGVDGGLDDHDVRGKEGLFEPVGTRHGGGGGGDEEELVHGL